MIRAILAVALLLAAPAAAQTLRIGFKAAVDGADPHQTFTPNRNVQLHVWETLTTQDLMLRVQPLLAQSWRSRDPLTWEFQLRTDARFSDGTPFTAEDAVFSIRRAQAAQGPRTYAASVRNIIAVEAEGPHLLVVRTSVPTPLQPDLLANIAMVSARAAVDAQDADFNGGRAAIGTAPYRWVRWTPAQDVIIERNPLWRGAAEPWPRVQFRFVPNDSARIAALLAGDIDVADYIPPSLFTRVRENEGLRLVTDNSVFTHYFYLDAKSARISNASGADGAPLAENPLRDPRVRSAISHAINRAALAERVMEGAATATGQVAPAGFIGHDPGIPVPRFDPALARTLLAEAGYARGFGLTVHCTLDRFAGDARVCQGIGQMLAAIGIRAQIEALPMPVYLRRSSTLLPDGVPELSAHMAMFGSSTGIASEGLTALMRTPNPARAQGMWNRTRYSNPRLDAMLAEVDSIYDPAAREAAAAAAVRYAMAQNVALPVFHVHASWGLRRALIIPARGDGYTMATDIRPAP